MASSIIDQPQKKTIYKPIMTNSDLEEILPASGIYNTTTTATQKTIKQEEKSLMIVQSEDIPRPKRQILGFSCSGGCCC